MYNLNQNVKWPDFIEYINAQNGPTQLDNKGCHHAHDGLHLKEKGLPISISAAEFNLIRDLVVKKNAQYCYDLATGVGVSALAIAQGLSKTGGHLLTMDSYAEEATQDQPIGISSGDCNTTALALKFARWMLYHFDLEDHVTLAVGWSPNDARTYIKEMFFKHGNLLDFIMLDCAKSSADLKRDIDMLIPFLDPNATLVIHDTHTFDIEADHYLISKFGKTYCKIYDFPSGRQSFPLAILELGV